MPKRGFYTHHISCSILCFYRVFQIQFYFKILNLHRKSMHKSQSFSQVVDKCVIYSFIYLLIFSRQRGYFLNYWFSQSNMLMTTLVISGQHRSMYNHIFIKCIIHYWINIHVDFTEMTMAFWLAFSILV